MSPHPSVPGRRSDRLPVTLLMAVLALGLGPLSCASSGVEGDRARPDRNLLTAEEIQRSQFTDLYSVIDERRPRWLRSSRVVSPMSMSTGETVVVYLDQSRAGGPEVLRGLTVDGIHSVQYLSGPEAQQRFGLDHRMGAIVVSFYPGR
jgi:hypothetical protein